MALKVELKPHEQIIIGACVVTNTDQRARLLIEGDRIPSCVRRTSSRPRPPTRRPNWSISRCS